MWQSGGGSGGGNRNGDSGSNDSGSVGGGGSADIGSYKAAVPLLLRPAETYRQHKL